MDERLFASEWMSSAWVQGTLSLTILVLLLSLRKIVMITPSLLGAFVRLKENFNIEDSLRLRNTRNHVAFMSVLSMTIICARYRLLPYDFPWEQTPVVSLATTGAFIVLLWLYRKAATAMFVKAGKRERTYRIANGTAHTYFIIATALTYIVAAVLYISDTDRAGIMRIAILAASGLVYAVFLIREIQIFVHTSRSAYSTFLYLCTLEIIPAAIVLLPILL